MKQKQMRRKDKEITEEDEIKSILKENDVCRLALSDENTPYIVPMDYGYDGDKTIYFHSAREGQKIDIIKKNSKACFEVTDSIKTLPQKSPCDFSVKYRSAICFGEISIINDEDEKKRGLEAILKQHGVKGEFKFPENELKAIFLLKFEIGEMSGKKSGFLIN